MQYSEITNFSKTFQSLKFISKYFLKKIEKSPEFPDKPFTKFDYYLHKRSLNFFGSYANLTT